MKNFIREMKRAGIKGVLSDIDGTLLDSMGLWYDIDVAFMKMKGISMPSDLQMQIAGMSMYETALYFRRTFGIEDSAEVLMETWNEMARDAYLHRIELKAGAEEFLNALLDEGIPVALATSNSRHLVESSIERHEVFHRLHAIVTADPEWETGTGCLHRSGEEYRDCSVGLPCIRRCYSGCQSGKCCWCESHRY